MLAKRELRKYAGDVRVWVGRYKNLTNLPHWHDDCEIVYADKGGAEVSVGGELMRLPENGAVFIEPRSTHYIRAEKDGVLSFFLFDRLGKTGVRGLRPKFKCWSNMPRNLGILTRLV